MKCKIKTSTIVRCVILAIAIINSLLAAFGIVPEQIVGNEQTYQVAVNMITGLAAAWTAWKNNSFTQAALKADEYLAVLKSGGVGDVELPDNRD